MELPNPAGYRCVRGKQTASIVVDGTNESGNIVGKENADVVRERTRQYL